MTGARTYRRVPRIVRAEALNTVWVWSTANGDEMTANPGDFRVWDPDVPSAPWSVTAEALAWGYQLLGDGVAYESKGEVRARQVDIGGTSEVVSSTEGDGIARPGDWIVTDPEGRQWIVTDSEFARRYALSDRPSSSTNAS